MQMRYYRRVSTLVGRVYAAGSSEWHFAGSIALLHSVGASPTGLQGAESSTSNILLALLALRHTLEVLLRRMKISKLPAVHVLGSAFLSVAAPIAALEALDRCCRERAATASL